MTGHILTGNEKDLDRVIRENRVRVNRGLIKFIPVSESGMIHNGRSQESCRRRTF